MNQSLFILRYTLLAWIFALTTHDGLAQNNQPTSVEPQKGEMAGYLLVPHSKVSPEYNAGFSMYVAAWPLLQNYPGQEFQSGLFGTWMFAQFPEPAPKNHYSDIEGGLGWWRDTRFATETPKFIMGGVALNFREWANGPGAGKGRNWDKPAGHYAIAQLSPWILWPPDGLNLKQGTCGELFGYGYLPLPLTDPKKTTEGKPVPTGNHCWTLFINSGNFKGPVTFFLPYFWSQPSVDKPELAGMFLDSMPSNPNKAIQMETQHIPAYLSKDNQGTTYARVAPTWFPAGQDDAVLIHRVSAYSKAALWDKVQAWFEGGPEASGVIDTQAVALHEFESKGGATWRIYPPNTAREDKLAIAWNSFANPAAIDKHTYGYRWGQPPVQRGDDSKGRHWTLPEYYRLEKKTAGNKETEIWVAIDRQEVPKESGLHGVEFPRVRTENPGAYVTPEDPQSVWKKPGPAAGPFECTLGDGSKVTYYWYRFCEQPALWNADMSDQERQAIQLRVEKLHRVWSKNREYLPPPTRGSLADIDPALIVQPPSGLEVGYVPIVTRQEK
ncbi:MAG: hypothetical protein ACKOAU_06425 [Pirellula sp.]